jgi:hypothetical protein
LNVEHLMITSCTMMFYGLAFHWGITWWWFGSFMIWNKLWWGDMTSTLISVLEDETWPLEASYTLL